MRYKSLFIDLDDTLWDTFHNNKECLKELYAELRLERHYASFEAFFSRYMPNNLELWAKYRRGEIDRLTLIIERFRPFLRPLGIVSQKDILKINNHFLAQTTKQTRLIPGAIELLEHLRDFSVLGRPVLVGIADKRFTHGDTEKYHRIALLGGADILRVHDVAAARRLVGRD